ncbi:hypothetical protein, partial [Mesorhizobium sp.]|uniref:hypothetical protein n=1 Tax=Mesorhizobium sp. TaxID=1871066 RepID=UPI00257FD1A8
MPIDFLTLILMFTSQCNTGLDESRFKKPDTTKNAGASSRPASNQDFWSWGMGLGNWGRLGLANSSPDPGHRSMAKGIAALLA